MKNFTVKIISIGHITHDVLQIFTEKPQQLEMPGNISLMIMHGQRLIGGEKTDLQEFLMLNVSFVLPRLFGMGKTRS